MKEVAILLLAVLLLNGCGNDSTRTQTAAGGTWYATMIGGKGVASGFSFTTSFTVSGSGGTLSLSSFQFATGGLCFPVNGDTVGGTMVLTESSTFEVTGPLTFTVQSGGNTLTLTGTVTGTENGVFGTGTSLSGATATGSWTYTGGTSTAGCNVDTSGSFTMTQSS
jgi:fibronectin-binding autotransporter adhesin